MFQQCFLKQFLPRKYPCFAMEQKDVEVLHEPKQFYNKLMELTTKSKKRIVLSSLYIGTSEMEKALVANLRKSIDEKPNLNLTILVDYMRGNRLNDSRDITSSTKALISPLLGDKTDIAFYLSPLYSNWWRKQFLFRQQKWNEIISLQHIKCYIFDDNLIISGANLSENYFTNRQDRYICLYNCKRICDYFEDLVKVISSFSLKLQKSGDFVLDSSWSYHPLNSSTQPLFLKAANKRITELQEKYSRDMTKVNERTIIIPFLQMKTFNITDDEHFTSLILKRVPSASFVRLTTGYFNLTRSYMKIILNQSSTQSFNILMASENANGFYGANGLMSNIPSVYTHLARKFLRKVEANGRNIILWSYNRENWTFHAKGMWIYFQPNIMLTTVGSPNFGYRSVNRDLEAQIAVITDDEELKSKLTTEYNYLWKYSQPVEHEQQLPAVKLWIRMISNFLKAYF